ncbi:CsbD family protein [Phenylobacterium sp.]|uniref:CsbD family protein n=1 Tax=Phenylobacterium sp. TaxID=1871053 RepID=UPI00272611B6|nr:CsbD family protein [Phenylobacterium sp.]MDO8379559.1 CsbD family protein [Phenylobacterium sp.]
MHKDTIKGAAKDASGSIKEAAGKLTGDERLEAEGAAEKTVGKIQKGVGDLKDAARNALKN